MYSDSEIFAIQLTIARMATQLEAGDRANNHVSNETATAYAKRAWELFRAAEDIVSGPHD